MYILGRQMWTDTRCLSSGHWQRRNSNRDRPMGVALIKPLQPEPNIWHLLYAEILPPCNSSSQRHASVYPTASLLWMLLVVCRRKKKGGQLHQGQQQSRERRRSVRRKGKEGSVGEGREERERVGVYVEEEVKKVAARQWLIHSLAVGCMVRFCEEKVPPFACRVAQKSAPLFPCACFWATRPGWYIASEIQSL